MRAAQDAVDEALHAGRGQAARSGDPSPAQPAEDPSAPDVGGLEGCSDAAYQGVLHIREEAAREGPAGNHQFDMTDDQLADYLDGYTGRTDGTPLKRGGEGWHDAALGVTVIKRGEYSMTMFRESAEAFARRAAG
ncbi:hypothetical protein AB0M20_39570 [Actinoplanes sp. NPDC051633]|uniref:hypothetical protein n=1 Tax=Actinoplanes sp. NPDC051633 TaxID=3155670 RepID=UPI003419A07B